MQFKTLLFATFASLSVAATTTTSAAGSSSTACAAQNVLNVCVSQYQAMVQSCEGNDWDCLCAQYQNLLTCYNNCPNSPERSPVENQVTQYCTAASQYGSMTKTTTAGSSSTTLAAQTTSNNADPAATTSSGTTASPTQTPNSAANLEVAGGLLALVFAGFGILA